MSDLCIQLFAEGLADTSKKKEKLPTSPKPSSNADDKGHSQGRLSFLKIEIAYESFSKLMIAHPLKKIACTSANCK